MPVIKAGAFDLDYVDTGSGPIVVMVHSSAAAIASGSDSSKPYKAATA